MADAKGQGQRAAEAGRAAAAIALELDPRLAEEAFERVLAADPLDAISRLALAQLKTDRGDLAAAEADAARAFAEAVEQTAKALAAFALGEIALARGRKAEAKNAFAASHDLFEAILKSDPGDYDALRHHARACQRLAEFTVVESGAALGRLAHAEALTVLETLSEREDAKLDLAEDLALGCARLAALSVELGDLESAEKCAEACVGWRLRLADGEPDVAAWREDLAAAYEAQAAVELLTRRYLQARESCDRAIKLRVGIAAAAPHDARRRRLLAASWRLSAQCAARVEEWAHAKNAAAQARALAERDGSEAGVKALYTALLLEGDIALKAHDLEGARQAFAQACEFAQSHVERDPEWTPLLAAAWERLGDVGAAAARHAGARDAFARARALLGASDKKADARLSLKAGEAALAAGDRDGARTAFTQSCSVRLALVEASPNDFKLARDLAVGMERIGLLAQSAGDKKLARAAWRDELKIADALMVATPRDEAAIRFCAIVHAHIVTLEETDMHAHRADAFALLDQLEAMGKLSENDKALRARLERA
ncbi:MAG: hypothetical protein AB7J28_06380 [Hyphomonadaceae bacterium]